jgi:DNA-binding XRE family transcriptional regulator
VVVHIHTAVDILKQTIEKIEKEFKIELAIPIVIAITKGFKAPS